MTENLQDFFDKFNTYCEPNGTVGFNWGKKGTGFGQVHFYRDQAGVLMCDNELMSKAFIKEILCQMVDSCAMELPSKYDYMPFTTRCPKCSDIMTYGGTSSTYVGYLSPRGHNHDDNCLSRRYSCACGNQVKVSKQNKCDADGCDWVGKSECGCCGGIKLTDWPTDA